MRRTLDGPWDSVHPGIDEARSRRDPRAAALVARLEHLPALAQAVAGSRPRRRSILVVLARGLGGARGRDALAERRARAAAGVRVGTAEWDAAFARSRAPSSIGCTRRSRAARPSAGIDAFCGERSGAKEGPHLYPLQTQLDTMLEFLVARGPQRRPRETPTRRRNRPWHKPASRPRPQHPRAAGPIATARTRLKRLREIGEYFKRNEPHSPLSLLIARAVRWGDMTFEELVRDLARNADLKQIWETSGCGR